MAAPGRNQEHDGPFFRNVAERSLCGILVTDQDERGRCWYANPEFQRITGYTCEMFDTVGAWLDAAFPDTVQRQAATVHRDHVARTAESRDGTFSITCADQEVREVRVRVARLCDDRLVTTMLDISESERLEAALRLSESRYRALVETSPTPIVVHCDGRIYFVNPATVAAFAGTSTEDFLGRWVQDFVHPDSMELIDARMRSLYTQEETRLELQEEKFIRLDGSVMHARVTATATEYMGRPAGLVVLEDVTERKRAEEKRRVLEERVRRAQKLESLGILAGGVAHDFNNLLVGILGNAELAASELGHASPASARIRGIEVAARRAASLAREMLVFTGGGQLAVEWVLLNEVVSETVQLVEVAMSDRIHIRYELDPAVSRVEIDPTQVRQLLMNLMTNAAEALPDSGGLITVRTGVVECERSHLRSALAADDVAPGTFAFIEVEDEGVGMSPETQARMFDPFFTTKFTGRGLGLAAVLGIVRGHRGALEFESEIGRGSRFRVLLPAVEGTPATVAREARRSPPSRRSDDDVVLIVDDDPTVREVSELMLTRAGYRPLGAASGEEALDVFRERGESIRCVILDLTMPDMDGPTTLRELRKLSTDVPVVLSSGYHPEDARSRGEWGEDAPYLQKPYTSQQLVSVIKGTARG